MQGAGKVRSEMHATRERLIRSERMTYKPQRSSDLCAAKRGRAEQRSESLYGRSTEGPEQPCFTF